MSEQLTLVAPATLTIDVIGHAVPKGRMKCIGGRGKVKHQLIDDTAALPGWTAAIVKAASARLQLTGWRTAAEAVCVEAWVWFKRPKSEPDRPYPHTRAVGDIDKIGRGILDALVLARVLKDDSLVVDLLMHERYSTTGRCGARIVVSEVR